MRSSLSRILGLPDVDQSALDTLVVSAREEGFQRVFLGENRWWTVLTIKKEIRPQLKYIAVYRAAPISAITHYAEIKDIRPFGGNTQKLLIDLVGPPKPIGPLRLVQQGEVKAPQSHRYTQFSKLLKARNLDEAF